MPAPICTEGPSRPIEWPDPMQSTPVRNLPIGTRAGNVAAVEPIRRLGLRHAAAANIREDRRQQNAGDEADQGGHQEQTQRPGASPKNRWLVRSIARVKSTADETREDPDDDRQGQKQLVLAKPELLEARRQGHAHCAPSPCRLAMSSSARSSASGDPQTRSARRSPRTTTSNAVSIWSWVTAPPFAP